MASSWADVAEESLGEGKEDQKELSQSQVPSNGSAKRRRKKKPTKEVNEESDSSDGASGGWETFGRKKEKTQKEKLTKPSKNKSVRTNKSPSTVPSETTDLEFKSQRWVFVAPIHELDEVSIRKHFEENYGEIATLVIPHPKKDQPKPSHCFILFKDLNVVETLIKKHHDLIPSSGTDSARKSVRVEMKRYEPDPKKFWDKKKLDEEKLLHDSQSQPKGHSKNVRIIEKRTTPKYLTPGQEYNWTITVENTSTQDRTLLKVYPSVKRPDFIVLDKILRKAKGDSSVILTSGEKHEISIKFTPKQPGIVTQKLVFEFTTFQVHHDLTLLVGSEEEMKLLEADTETADYVQVDELKQSEESKRTVIPAFPQGRVSKIHIQTSPNDVGEYPLPENTQGSDDQPLNFNPWMVRENYKSRLHNILFAEEAQRKITARKYDVRETLIEKVDSFTRGGKVVNLPEPCSRFSIPGLSQRRPPISHGDVLYASVGSTNVDYEGYVYRVDKDIVLAVFHPEFHSKFPQGTKFNVRFNYNRQGMRHMHQAIDVANVDLVWPPENTKPKENGKGRSHKNSQANVQSLKWFDGVIKTNDHQATAVLNILNNTNGIVPYLIFGASGTGKSRTIAELIRQVIVKDKGAKILVCAPSNGDADIFMYALKDVADEKNLFRLYPFTRNRDLVNPSILKFTSYDEKKEIFVCPPVDVLKTFKVIVTTSMASAALSGLGSKHFTHIILDEAAQMMEPEALIPISMANESTNIIMAGDDKQLGPRVQSSSANRHGLGNSIIERIVSLPVYKKCKDPLVCIELTRNYTLHPKILEFTSKLYGTKMQSGADQTKVNSLLGWNKLPNKKFPLFFNAVRGEVRWEGRDVDDKFNPLEATALVSLVDNLIQEQKLNQTDVGVITFYNNQAQKIQLLLSKRGLSQVKVGTPEEVRSHTFKAAFISTVVTQNHTDPGTLNKEKALITAVQSGSALLVIVGDPAVSQTEWKDLVEYCQKNDAYKDGEVTEETKENSAKENGVEVAKHTPSVETNEDQQEVPPVETTTIPIHVEEDNTKVNNKEVQENQSKEEVQPESQNDVHVEPRKAETSQEIPPTTHSVSQQVSSERSPIPPVTMPNAHLVPPSAPIQGGQSSQILPSQWDRPDHYQYQGMPVQQQLQAVLQGNRLPIPPPEMIYPPNPMMLPLTQNPVFMGSPYMSPVPSSNLPESYVWIHDLHGQQFIGYNKEGGYPPLVVYDKPDCVEIEISLFHLAHSIHYQANWIYIQLFQNLQMNFCVPTLYQGLSSSKEGSAELAIAVPEYLDMRLMDIGVSRTVMLITLPRRHPLGPTVNTNSGPVPMESNK